MFYVSFFAGTLFALVMGRRYGMQKLWLAVFMTVLVAVTITGSALVPVVEMHKFSQPNEQEMTLYEPRVVDGSGNELYYDYRAAPPTSSSRTSTIFSAVIHEYSDEDSMEIAEFYVSSANEYRQEVKSGDTSPVTWFQPPRYSESQRWTAEELEEYGEFETLRVYERTVTFVEGEGEIKSVEEEHRLTIDVREETISESGDS